MMHCSSLRFGPSPTAPLPPAQSVWTETHQSKSAPLNQCETTGLHAGLNTKLKLKPADACDSMQTNCYSLPHSNEIDLLVGIFVM